MTPADMNRLRKGMPVLIDGERLWYGAWKIDRIEGEWAVVSITHDSGQSDQPNVAVSRLTPLLGAA